MYAMLDYNDNIMNARKKNRHIVSYNNLDNYVFNFDDIVMVVRLLHLVALLLYQHVFKKMMIPWL